ncbi:hypothetical protein GCM10010306_083970 [Streptomyces umbrinus]|nr:hypothetical protein GCM10010306_083970 [Streptomyces umbrinus]
MEPGRIQPDPQHGGALGVQMDVRDEFRGAQGGGHDEGFAVVREQDGAYEVPADAGRGGVRGANRLYS